MAEFVSLEQAAAYNEVSKISLQKLRYKDKKAGRSDRFRDDKVLLDFKNPFEIEISKLYYKAAFIAGSEKKLIKELSNQLGLRRDSLRYYFKYFSFKHFKKAQRIKVALMKYCENSLWGDIEI